MKRFAYLLLSLLVLPFAFLGMVVGVVASGLVAGFAAGFLWSRSLQ
jgi:hypothetical protein